MHSASNHSASNHYASNHYANNISSHAAPRRTASALMPDTDARFATTKITAPDAHHAPDTPDTPDTETTKLHAVLWHYVVPSVDDQQSRDQVFLHMQEQGLLPLAMCAVAVPTLDQWRALTQPDKAWLLRCETLEPHPTLLGAALLTPWRHRVWEFDFTVFRPYFGMGPLLSRGALRWVWKHAPCDALMGLCPATHRHAWKLAEAGGFEVLGRLPGACFLAGREKGKRFVDGVLVSAQRHKK